MYSAAHGSRGCVDRVTGGSCTDREDVLTELLEVVALTERMC